MRSHPSLNKFLIPLALVAGISFQAPAVAHANWLDKLFAVIASDKSEADKAAEIAEMAKSALPPKIETISNGPFTVEKDFVQKSLAYVDTLHKTHNGGDLRSSVSLKSERVEQIHTDTHTRIVPVYDRSHLTLTLQYDELALQNPKLLLRDLTTLNALGVASIYDGDTEIKVHGFQFEFSKSLHREINSPHAIVELLLNAQEGSPTAKARWNSLQMALLSAGSLRPEFIQNLGLSTNALSEVVEELAAKKESLNAEAAQFARTQQKKLDKWKSETGALDKYEAMEQKLNDLILNNDRKGVRKMLEAYLPWAVMEPVEANTWRIWLDAIENPSKDHTTIAFRGVDYDTDKIQRRKTANGEVYGFMSTVLTKNQGNYTRRLRSLSTNREKNGDIGFKDHGSQVRSTKMTDQMTAHAINPQASSFLSFTYNPRVAHRFMGQDEEKKINGKYVDVPTGGFLAVKMDSRRLIPNVPSMFSTEIELLAPLIVFPDEVVRYNEGNFGDGEFEKFISELSKEVGIEFDKWKEHAVANQLRARYKADGLKFLKTMMNVGAVTRSCAKVFAD